MRYSSQSKFPAFSEYDVFSIIENQKKGLMEEITSQSDDYILNVNKKEYMEHLISRYSITPIVIHEDQLSVSTYEAQVPADHHPSSYFAGSGRSFPRDVVRYHLPFTGEHQLLRVRASSYHSAPPRIFIEGSDICFEIVNFDLTPERIKQEADRTIQNFKELNDYLTNDLNSFNSKIESIASQTFDARKEQLLKKNDLMASLGVPIRTSENTPSTFSIPTQRTKVIPTKNKPAVVEKGYKPEPSIDTSIYTQILGIINDVGKQFERLPSTYSGKDEEQLRDHLLLILEPNFEGSATGETFNKSGKTDILLRHEGSNVFIAELKFWKGKKSYLETISQLLGYLTWRDSKAAVVIFVKNKDFSTVIGTVKEETPSHENYLGFVSESEESWLNYRFHINNDRNREVKLAVMLYHIPEE